MLCIVLGCKHFALEQGEATPAKELLINHQPSPPSETHSAGHIAYFAT
jgi:hypothetical protein